MAQTSKLTIPTAAEWHAQIINDIELSAIDAGVDIPPTAEGSDLDLKAKALANALTILTANQIVLDSDNNPNTAEGDQLEEIRIADGLPEVPAKAASGVLRVTTTTTLPVTILAGAGTIAPGALLGTVSATSSVVTGSEIPFTMSKVGSAGNLSAGTIVRFTSPPAGLATEAVVVSDMIDGSDKESDPKKRRRILNRRQVPPKADNPSALREIALSSTNAIDNAFIYPGLGGGGTCKTVLTAPWYVGSGGMSRSPTASALNIVRSSYEANFPTKDRLYAVESAANYPMSFCVGLSVSSGLAGWLDSSPWPLVDNSITYYADPAVNTSFTVTLWSDSTPPVAGKNIAVWDSLSCGFRYSTILTATLVSGNSYALTVAPWQGGPVTMGYGLKLSPRAGNMAAWSDAILDIVGEQTPGENCYTWQRPRSLRYPIPSQDEPVGVGTKEIDAIVEQFDEIIDARSLNGTVYPVDGISPSSNTTVLVLTSLCVVPL